VNRSTGAKVAALAADAAGAEGIVSPLLLLDELPQWADTKAARGMFDAAYSSIPKVPGSRFVIIGHAGISGSWQHRLYEQAKASEVWRVHDVPGPLAWLDERLLADQRATLTPTQYARRHLNQWSTAEDSLTTVEDLRACVTLDGPLRPQAGLDYVVAVDIGLVNDRTVAVVCHAEAMSGGPPAEQSWRAPTERERYAAAAGGEPLPDRVPVTEVEPVRIVLDRIETWQGSKVRKVRLADVEDWLLQAHQSFNGAPIRFDPWQAVSTAQRLRANGVPVEEFAFSSASVGRLATTLHRLLRDGALALPDDDALLDELSHVRLVERTSGAVRMDHDSGRHDDQAIAVAMAAAWLLERPPARGVVVTEHGARGNALARGRTVARAR
jgi:phage terminase large subunit-like protein